MQANSQSSHAARTSYKSHMLPAVAGTEDSKAPQAVEPESSLALGTGLAHDAGLALGAGLAHDAGNLFGALGLYCDLLAAPGVLRPEHQHYISELRQLASRSGSLIESLLTIAPGADQASHPTALPEHASHPVVIPNAAATLRLIEPLLAAIAGPSVTVTCKAPRALPTPPLRSESLERILVNLVRNAAQAIESAEPPRPGNIRIALATISGHLRLTVEDNGPGMPVTTAAAFLSPSPLPKGARHGLGHRIVHELVTSSGGKLQLRVRPGRGTTITIHWPGPANAQPAQSAPAQFRGSRRLGAATC